MSIENGKSREGEEELLAGDIEARRNIEQEERERIAKEHGHQALPPPRLHGREKEIVENEAENTAQAEEILARRKKEREEFFEEHGFYGHKLPLPPRNASEEKILQKYYNYQELRSRKEEAYRYATIAKRNGIEPPPPPRRKLEKTGEEELPERVLQKQLSQNSKERKSNIEERFSKDILKRTEGRASGIGEIIEQQILSQDSIDSAESVIGTWRTIEAGIWQQLSQKGDRGVEIVNKVLEMAAALLAIEPGADRGDEGRIREGIKIAEQRFGVKFKE